MEVKKLNEKFIYRGITARSFSKNAEAYAGIFFGPTAKRVSGWGTPIKYNLSNKAKIFEYDSSDAFCYNQGLYNKEYKELNLICKHYNIDVKNLSYFTQLERGEPRKELDKKVQQIAGSQFCWYDLWTWCTQLVAKIELEKMGYDGALWKQEDFGNPIQYQIWNLDVVKTVEEENLKNNKMNTNIFKFKLVEDKSLQQ